MIPKAADVVIIGGGIMGLSTAYHLARRGCRDVIVLEREEHLGGYTTSRCAGGIRHQFSTRINVQMSLLSIRMLESIEEELGIPVSIRWCGYLFVLTEKDDIEAFKHAVDLQRKLGVDTRWLSVDVLHERFPMVNLEDAVAGTFYGRDGLADPSAVANGYATAARRLGATLVTGIPVIDILVKGGGGGVYQVVTPQGRIATPAVVNAAGPWAAEIGRMIDIVLPIRPVRQQLFVTGPMPEIPTDFPVLVFPAQGLGFHREGDGLLTGLTNPAEESLSAREVYVDRVWEARHRDVAIRRLPSLQEARIVSRWAGLYEMTPDLHPILGHIPSAGGFYCIAGFSGHGFMHGPISGLLLSEEMLDGKVHSLNIDPLRLDRFQYPQQIERYII
jgi:sarcosine oxidase subunit beta